MTARREILATPLDLVRAAAGIPVQVVASDGEEVVLRIPTPCEFRQQTEQVRQWLTGAGFPVPPPPTDDQVRRILTPLGGES